MSNTMGKDLSQSASRSSESTEHTTIKPVPTSPPNSKSTKQRTAFREAVYDRLDKPSVAVFRLGCRTLQLAFALASGISYALELSHGTVDSSANSAFIYAQVIFGLTLAILIFDAATLRAYHFTWLVEWTMFVLYIALFGVFYNIFIPKGGMVEERFDGVDVGRMRRAVWMDLINALLWMGSAIFSTTVCCSGMRAGWRGKKESWKARRDSRKMTLKSMGEMEEGVVRT